MIPEWAFTWGVNDLVDGQVDIPRASIDELIELAGKLPHAEVIASSMDIGMSSVPGVVEAGSMPGTEPPRVVTRRGQERRTLEGRKLPTRIVFAEIWDWIPPAIKDQLERLLDGRRC